MHRQIKEWEIIVSGGHILVDLAQTCACFSILIFFLTHHQMWCLITAELRHWRQAMSAVTEKVTAVCVFAGPSVCLRPPDVTVIGRVHRQKRGAPAPHPGAAGHEQYLTPQSKFQCCDTSVTSSHDPENEF